MTQIKEVTKTLDTVLFTETTSGLRIQHPVRLTVSPSRIEFTTSPFALKGEIKAMQGARWAGYDELNPKKVWTIDNCHRNWFQLKYLMGLDTYEWFDRPLVEHTFRDFELTDSEGNTTLVQPRAHQKLMTNTGLTYHYQVWGAEMGTGKTLAAICLMEMSAINLWFWLGPLKSLENIEREWKKWKLPLKWAKPANGNEIIDVVRAGEHNVILTTYERLVKFMEGRKPDDPIPGGLIGDESSRLKSPNTQRSKAAQDLADLIRSEYGMDGYVILMSGTPSPKSPLDWWKQCEIAYPGFLKEGSIKALEQRLAFLVKQQYADGMFDKRVGWKDNEKKCETCGETKENGPHLFDPDTNTQVHSFRASKNEVAYMYDRLHGLATIIHKKDVLDLPEKVYEVDYCDVSPSTMRVARTLAKSAPNTITGITWLRELSDGFMYKDIPDGHMRCPTCHESAETGKVPSWFDEKNPDQPISSIDMLDAEYVSTLKKVFIECPRCKGTCQVPKMKRVSREVPCPKEKKLKNRLSQCEETGRIVIFAGFQGSIDRIAGICRKDGWDVVQCDGRGWRVTGKDGKVIKTNEPLAYWADLEKNPQVAFVAHPQSGGLSLNLTEARMAVFWSNDFNPESRSQAEDRIHRLGSDENVGVKIVDFFHLPSDEKVREILKQNRKLELMTMGDVLEDAFDT
jgi:SNF2 family DNA or RNA helicase